MRRFASGPIVAAGSVCVALAAGELICRLALPRPGFIPLSGNWFPGAVISHPTRSYQLAPNLNTTIARATYGTMQLRTNGDGLRERPLDSLRGAQIRILAVGNSFTFGTGVADEDTWPTRLEAALHERMGKRASVVVINAGVPAYGLAQIRDLTEELLPRVSPQIVILDVFAGGFDRMRDPFTVLQDFVIRSSQRSGARVVEGGLLLSSMTQPRARSFDLWLQAHTYLGAYLFERTNALRARLPAARGAAATAQHADSLDALAQGLAQVQRIQDDAAARGIPLLVMISTAFDEDNRVYPDQQHVAEAVARFCARQGIPVFDPTSRLEAAGVSLRVSRGDHHLSAAANVLIAGYLTDVLLRLPRPLWRGQPAHATMER